MDNPDVPKGMERELERTSRYISSAIYSHLVALILEAKNGMPSVAPTGKTVINPCYAVFRQSLPF
jgi:hypothetical protein